MVAEADGKANANRDWSKSWEKFTPKKYADNVMSFQSYHGKYLVCEPDGKVLANREWMKSWEAFHVYKSSSCPNRKLGSICIAIKSAEHDKWIRATEDGELVCDVGGDYVPKDAVFYGWTANDLSFKLQDIRYNVSSAKIDNYQIIETGSMILDNRDNKETNKTISVESDGIITNQIFHSYETHDYNFKLSRNLTFYAKTPFVHTDNSLWLTEPHKYMWGHRAANQLITRVNQTCEAPPSEMVKCTSFMGIMDVSVGYLMKLHFTQLGMPALFANDWEG